MVEKILRGATFAIGSKRGRVSWPEYKYSADTNRSLAKFSLRLM